MALRERRTEIERLAIAKIPFLKYFNEHVAGIKPGVRQLLGDNRATICPFHDDTDPSFHYWAARNGCRCFGCHKGGDLIDTYRLIESQYRNRVVTEVQAAKELLDMYRVDYSQLADTKEMTVFEQAKRELWQRNPFEIPAGVMTVQTFVKQNREILETFEDDIDKRIEYFNKLDRRAALVMGEYVDNKA